MVLAAWKQRHMWYGLAVASIYIAVDNDFDAIVTLPRRQMTSIAFGSTAKTMVMTTPPPVAATAANIHKV